ncbi:MAG: amino acid deaminase/aldolase [Bacteroidetes bacterium]|nr:amino acid deaminase/aldolase [Bacteroidota bacterium]
MNSHSRTYDYYKKIFVGQPMPFAFVDMDLLEENARQIVKRAKDKKIRIASKSVRCRTLLNKILDMDTAFQGIMCFTVPEAVYLSKQGFDDLLVAYPCMQEQYIAEACQEVQKGKTIVLMADCLEHVQRIDQVAGKVDVALPVCMDIDMSTNFPGLHFGVWRSGIFNKKQVLNLVEQIQQLKNVRLDGIMGYEAQIAGVGDNYEGQSLKNMVIRFLKSRSVKEIARRRHDIAEAIKNGVSGETPDTTGVKLRFINGGGTGSLESTTEEDVVTEVTVGSGFYASALFDNYKNFRHLPSAGFAIEIVRRPQHNMFTCHGGGYVASGAAGADKLPKPYLPEGMKITKNEGAGEVQTPLIYKGFEKLSLGDPIFMRHSKAGELCERFDKLLLVSEGKIVDEVKTYRGEGKCFL